MAKLVKSEWVVGQIATGAVVIVDPRRPMKYLAGHLPDAINIPVYKAFGADGVLLDPKALAQFIGGAGLGDDETPILCDSPEGQNAAMLAWILDYLGHDDVMVMEDFFETWKKSGREVRYKPVVADARCLTPRPYPTVRITIEEVREGRSKLIDFRSSEEYSGERVLGDDTPGHIPGARNVVWRELGQGADAILKPSAELKQVFAREALNPGDAVVAYCRSGPRAALGYLALRQAGYNVRLFDGSWAQWSRLGLPSEK